MGGLKLTGEIGEAKTARPQRGWVVLAKSQCAPRQPHALRDLAVGARQPAVRPPAQNAPGRHPIGRGIVRIEFYRALVEPPRVQEAVPREEMEAGHSAQEVVVTAPALGRLSPGALDLRPLEPWLDGTNDACGHAILQVKDVFEGAVEPIRPDVAAGRRIDELPGDAHARSGLAHAAFE